MRDRAEQIRPTWRGREEIAVRPDGQENVGDHVLGRRAAEAPDVLGRPDGLRVTRVEEADQMVRGGPWDAEVRGIVYRRAA